MLPPGLSRETHIRRDARGRWFDGDDPVEHAGISRAFDAWIDRAEDGRFILKNSVNWAYVSIEGAPLFVRDARVDEGGVWIALSDARVERLEPRTLRQDPDGALYCQARAGAMAAAFDRGAAMQLEDALGEDEDGVYLALGGERWRVPVVAEPLSYER